MMISHCSRNDVVRIATYDLESHHLNLTKFFLTSDVVSLVSCDGSSGSLIFFSIR